jgi:hypothetical protein
MVNTRSAGAVSTDYINIIITIISTNLHQSAIDQQSTSRFLYEEMIDIDTINVKMHCIPFRHTRFGSEAGRALSLI